MGIAAYRLIALLGVLVLAATGCGSGGPVSPATSTTTHAATASYAKAPCPNPIYPSVPRFDLGAGVECGYLTVPQNRADPDGRKIRLVVATRKSTSPNPKPDPVVYLAGGPGGTALVHGFDNWQLDRDLILLGERGTIKDDPFLSCPEVDQFLADAVGIGAEDPVYDEKSAAALRTCRDRLTKQGINLAAYNTTENAADVADLRIAMGIDQWNIYALSYGTDLALQTLRDHPEGIRSVVLDSVLPPQANLMESGWASAAAALRRSSTAAPRIPPVRRPFPMCATNSPGW